MSITINTLNRLASVGLLSLVLCFCCIHHIKANTPVAKSQAIYQALEPYILDFDIDARSVGEESSSKQSPSGHNNLIVKIAQIIKDNKPIEFLCLAFPFKSSNRSDLVLGAQPDMAEFRSLQYLQTMLAKVKSIYPKVSLTIFTDGLLFNELFHIKDATVVAYEKALIQLCSNFPDIKIVTLAKALNDHQLSLRQFRANADQHAVQNNASSHSLQTLKKRIQGEINHKDHPFHSLNHQNQEKELGRLAHQLIGRDLYLKDFVKQYQNDHTIRLSIHYQRDISDKVGIKLSPTSTVFPWNGVLVEDKSGDWRILPKNQLATNTYACETQVTLENIALPLCRWR